MLKNTFGWAVIGNFSIRQLKIIYQTGCEITRYADKLTNGNGHSWITKNLGNTLFVRNGIGPWLIDTSFVYPYYQVNLMNNFEVFDDNPDHYIAHELGHVFDNNNLTKKKTGPATFFGNGSADDLAKFAEISPSDFIPRWWHNHPFIPERNRFPLTAWGGYGNYDTADYFAEAFSRVIFDPKNMPENRGIKTWINSYISHTK